jgi:hypothetical protein
VAPPIESEQQQAFPPDPPPDGVNPPYYDTAEDPPSGDECIDESGTEFSRRHPI